MGNRIGLSCHLDEVQRRAWQRHVVRRGLEEGRRVAGGEEEACALSTLPSNVHGLIEPAAEDHELPRLPRRTTGRREHYDTDVLEALAKSVATTVVHHAVYCRLHLLLVASRYHQDERWADGTAAGSRPSAPGGEALHGVLGASDVCDEQADDVYEWEQLSMEDLISRLYSSRLMWPLQKRMCRGLVAAVR